MAVTSFQGQAGFTSSTEDGPSLSYSIMIYSILEKLSRVPLRFLPTHEEIMAHYPSLELLSKTASLSTIHNSQDMETT